MKQIALSFLVIAASGAYVWEQAGKNTADDMLGEPLPASAAAQDSAQPTQAASAATLPAIGTAPSHLEPRLRTRFPIAREMTAGIAVNPTRSIDRGGQTAASQASRSLPALAELPKLQPQARALSYPAPSASPFAVTPAVYIPVPQPRPVYPDAPARVLQVGMKQVSHGYADGVYTGPSADAYYGMIQIQALVNGGQLTALKVLKYPSDRRTSVSINRQALPMLRDEAISAQSADVDIISGATLTSRAFIQSLRGALNKAAI
jgi:uncharacterized protein with FMN-binding domain